MRLFLFARLEFMACFQPEILGFLADDSDFYFALDPMPKLRTKRCPTRSVARIAIVPPTVIAVGASNLCAR